MQPIISSWLNYFVIQILKKIINRKRVMLVVLLKLCWLTEGVRLRDALNRTPATVIAVVRDAKLGSVGSGSERGHNA